MEIENHMITLTPKGKVLLSLLWPGDVALVPEMQRPAASGLMKHMMHEIIPRKEYEALVVGEYIREHPELKEELHG